MRTYADAVTTTERMESQMMEQTFEKLYEMRLGGMVEAAREQAANPNVAGIPFEERFTLVVDREWDRRQTKALQPGCSHLTAIPGYPVARHANVIRRSSPGHLNRGMRLCRRLHVRRDTWSLRVFRIADQHEIH